jgi:D-alanyl-D-alanine endopeptidase (penicillin-binding protein 7)
MPMPRVWRDMVGAIFALVLAACSATGVAAAGKAEQASAGKAKSVKTKAASAGKGATLTSKAIGPGQVKARRSAKPAQARKAIVVRPRRVSMGERIGLHQADDPLDLRSGVALVVDQETDQVLFSKNPDAVLPIASITKLMTAMVVTEAGQDLSEPIEISDSDVEAVRGNRSRLKVGTRMTRGELLHLALMASENRAAHALGRQYPGGLSAFVSAMNDMATNLGMSDTRYVEPTGLSSQNQSSARDLSLLVKAAYQQPLIRQLSTMPEAAFDVGSRQVQFRNTNGLVRHPEWDIGLQKTGYISEAGRCVVMQAELAGRKLIMVLLDSAGKYSRIGDAERIRRWLTDASELLSQRR